MPPKPVPTKGVHPDCVPRSHYLAALRELQKLEHMARVTHVPGTTKPKPKPTKSGHVVKKVIRKLKPPLKGKKPPAKKPPEKHPCPPGYVHHSQLKSILTRIAELKNPKKKKPVHHHHHHHHLKPKPKP